MAIGKGGNAGLAGLWGAQHLDVQTRASREAPIGVVALTRRSEGYAFARAPSAWALLGSLRCHGLAVQHTSSGAAGVHNVAASRRGKAEMRREILDGTEVIGGYARAVVKGGHVHVSGTTSMAASGEVVGEDLYQQTRETYRKIARVLSDAGAAPGDVVRVVAYVTDIGDPGGFMRAHAEHFGDIRPAATLVEVSGLLKPEMLVEIEAYAILD